MDISSTNCGRCKQKVKEGANFCIYCGYKIADKPSSKLNSCKSESKSKYQINVNKAKSVYDIKNLPSSPSSNRNMSALHKKSKISIPSRYSFNKTTTSKKMLSEEFDFLMRPNSASFISYRDDSKYFKDVESKDKTLDEIQDMIGIYYI
jgi:Na+-transporting NADH:ubiquinone oxidoreductase subunit NqrF